MLLCWKSNHKCKSVISYMYFKVFSIVQFPGCAKTVLSGESLYIVVVVDVQSYYGCKIVVWNLWSEWQALSTAYLCYIVSPECGHAKTDICYFVENIITNVNLLFFPKP